MFENLPVLGICGWSGSGKTTLIERLVPILRARGLDVAVVKHDAHGIDIDRPGKDSDRLFQAGADVVLRGPEQSFVRMHCGWRGTLPEVVRGLAARYDLVLVEGHKDTPIPKIWLLGDGEDHPPPGLVGVSAVFRRDEDRVGAAAFMVEEFLSSRLADSPLLGCVLIGGKRSGMGCPKPLPGAGGETSIGRTVAMLEKVVLQVVIVGSGETPAEVSRCPRLPDAPDARGPLAGLLSAMRWSPTSSWLVSACDLPDLRRDALAWILSVRRPGLWAVLPHSSPGGDVKPHLAWYDYRARTLLESMAAKVSYSLADLAAGPKCLTPVADQPLAQAMG